MVKTQTLCGTIESESATNFIQNLVTKIITEMLKQKVPRIESETTHNIGSVRFVLTWYADFWSIKTKKWTVIQTFEPEIETLSLYGSKKSFERDLIMLMMFHEH